MLRNWWATIAAIACKSHSARPYLQSWCLGSLRCARSLASCEADERLRVTATCGEMNQIAAPRDGNLSSFVPGALHSTACYQANRESPSLLHRRKIGQLFPRLVNVMIDDMRQGALKSEAMPTREELASSAVFHQFLVVVDCLAQVHSCRSFASDSSTFCRN